MVVPFLCSCVTSFWKPLLFILFIFLHPVDVHYFPDIAASAGPGAHANACDIVRSDESKIIIKS